MTSHIRKLLLAWPIMMSSAIVTVSWAEEGQGSPLIGWDQILDPDEDCKITSTISISVPAVRHDLNPRRDINLFNAPRLLKKVSGDFTVQVRVTGDFDPSACGGGFLSAGLILWEDDSHFMRVERMVYDQDGETLCYYPPIAHYRNGNHIGLPPRFPPASEHYSGRSTWIRIQRKDERLILATSNDGKTWEIATKRKDLFPEEVSVGLLVTNYCGGAMTFEFDEFDIVLH